MEAVRQGAVDDGGQGRGQEVVRQVVYCRLVIQMYLEVGVRGCKAWVGGFALELRYFEHVVALKKIVELDADLVERCDPRVAADVDHVSGEELPLGTAVVPFSDGASCEYPDTNRGTVMSFFEVRKKNEVVAVFCF